MPTAAPSGVGSAADGNSSGGMSTREQNLLAGIIVVSFIAILAVIVLVARWRSKRLADNRKRGRDGGGVGGGGALSTELEVIGFDIDPAGRHSDSAAPSRATTLQTSGPLASSGRPSVDASVGSAAPPTLDLPQLPALS